jgi:hypothetical protein
MKRIDIFNLNISFKAEINSLSVEFNKIGLFIKIKKERPLLQFNNKKEELVFIILKVIKPVFKLKSLLNLI